MIWFIFLSVFLSFLLSFFLSPPWNQSHPVLEASPRACERARQEKYHFIVSTAHFIMVWMDLYLLGLHNKNDNFLYNELVFELMANAENEKKKKKKWEKKREKKAPNALKKRLCVLFCHCDVSRFPHCIKMLHYSAIYRCFVSLSFPPSSGSFVRECVRLLCGENKDGGRVENKSIFPRKHLA